MKKEIENIILGMSQMNLSELNLDNLKLGKSGKIVKLLYNNSPIEFTTGKMYAPFGVKIYNNEYSSFTNCYIDCSLNQSESEISIKHREQFEALDKKIIELIKESIHLFSSKNDIIYEDDNFYSPILRENKTYPKLIKISLPRDRNGNFDFVIFNENKEKIPIDDSNISDVLFRGILFKGIIECNKIWYYNGKFGSQWNLKQMKFEKKIEKIEKTNTPINNCIIND